MILIRDLHPALGTAERRAVSQIAQTASGCPFAAVPKFQWRLRPPRRKVLARIYRSASRDLSQRGSVQATALHQLRRDGCGVDLALERRIEEDRARRAPERPLDVAGHAQRVPGVVEIRALQRVEQQIQAQRTNQTPEDEEAHGLALVLELTVRELLLQHEVL